MSLSITNDKLNYSLLGINVDINDIEYFSFLESKQNLLIIKLNNFDNYKKDIRKKLISRLILLNLGSYARDTIFINMSVYKIDKKELSKTLKELAPKNIVLF